MALHNCLSVLGVFNKCLSWLILTVYFWFTAAFDLTVAGNSAADLFICCTPAVFSKRYFHRVSRQFNITCLNQLSYFLLFLSIVLKSQAPIFQLRTSFSKGNIYTIF